MNVISSLMQWKHLTTISVGGLEEVGFTNSGNIVVLSTQGRGILDFYTGDKIFRDDKNWWDDFQEAEGVIAGFGKENDDIIKISGLHAKNILKKVTNDGWNIYSESSFHGAIPILNFYLTHPNISEPVFIAEDGPCEVRTFGSSNDEKIMVVATSCELIVWKRD